MPTKPFESRIQDIVYNVDVGIGLRLIKVGLYLLFVVGIAVLYTATQFRGLKDAEAMDAAQVGRNLATGQGFTTKNIRPASLGLLQRLGVDDPKMQRALLHKHPELVQPPLYPLALAGLFKVVNPTFAVQGGEQAPGVYAPEVGMVVLGHIFTFIAGGLVFLLSRALFDARVGLLGTTLFFLSNKVWQTSISGLSLPLVLVFVLSACLLALSAVRAQDNQRKPIAWAIPLILSAILCGLAFLTRYGAGVFVPALALFIAVSFPRRGWRWALIYLLVVLAVISPWLVRNYRLTHNPLGLAPYTIFNTGHDPVMDNDFERRLAPEKSEATADPNKGLQVKFLTGMARLYRGDLHTLGEGLIGALFLVTFLYRFVRDAAHRFRWCLAVAIAALWILGALFGDGTARLLYLILPFATLYGLSFFFILMDRLQLALPAYRRGIVAALVVASSLPLIFQLLPPRESLPYPPYYAPIISDVSTSLKPAELLCTDMPWATAWYGDRNSLLLPYNIESFFDIYLVERISGIYMTPITTDRPYVRQLLRAPFYEWFQILEGRIPKEFPLNRPFRIFNGEQMFITDSLARAPARFNSR